MSGTRQSWSSPPPQYASHASQGYPPQAHPCYHGTADEETPLRDNGTWPGRKVNPELGRTRACLSFSAFINITFILVAVIFFSIRVDSRADLEAELSRRNSTINREISAIQQHWQIIDAKRRASEQQRLRAHLYWADVTPDVRCVQYDEKMYTAKLMNTDSAESEDERLKWCLVTEAVLHEGTPAQTPDYCLPGNDGVVEGHWKVKGVASCKPMFEHFQDIGCIGIGSGKRRIEAKLANVGSHDDWAEMCDTTPADINGDHYSQPHHCFDWTNTHSGYWGVWVIEDTTGVCHD